jgi:Fe-S cluster assembly protein SufD
MAKLDLSEHYEAQAVPGASAQEAAQRVAALARFRELGVPSKRLETWRYTETRPLARRGFLPIVSDPSSDQEHVVVPGNHQFAGDVYELQIIDGRLRDSEQLSALEAQGLRCRSTALGHETDLPDTDPQDLSDGLSALHMAFVSDLIQIEVRDDARIDRPLLIRRLSSTSSVPRLACPSVHVRLGSGARLTIIDQQIVPAASEDLVNANLRIDLAEGAQLDLSRLRVGADAGFHLDRCNVRLGMDSRLHATQLDIAGRWNRNELRVNLAAPGASVSLEGLYLPTDGQLHDNHLEIIHSAANTTSQQRYRGVLSGRSRGVFSGRVLIEQDAQRADATQENRNLLLSAEAEVDTKPELEIYADDVKAAHGATIGQLDESALFYLRSRGIDPETARALLVFAFADEVLTQLPGDALRSYVERHAMAVLPETAGVAGQAEIAQ